MSVICWIHIQVGLNKTMFWLNKCSKLHEKNHSYLFKIRKIKILILASNFYIWNMNSLPVGWSIWVLVGKGAWPEVFNFQEELVNKLKQMEGYIFIIIIFLSWIIPYTGNRLMYYFGLPCIWPDKICCAKQWKLVKTIVRAW